MVQKVSNVQHPTPAGNLKLGVLVQHLEKPQAHANFCTDEDKRKAGPIEFKLQLVAA